MKYGRYFDDQMMGSCGMYRSPSLMWPLSQKPPTWLCFALASTSGADLGFSQGGGGFRGISGPPQLNPLTLSWIRPWADERPPLYIVCDCFCLAAGVVTYNRMKTTACTVAEMVPSRHCPCPRQFDLSAEDMYTVISLSSNGDFPVREDAPPSNWDVNSFFPSSVNKKTPAAVQ